MSRGFRDNHKTTAKDVLWLVVVILVLAAIAGIALEVFR
jgi:hypothetical protein